MSCHQSLPSAPDNLMAFVAGRRQVRMWHRPALAVAAVVAAVVVGVGLAGGYVPLVGVPAESPSPAASPTPSGVPAVSSCEDHDWPVTTVSCAEAQQSASLGARSRSGTRIWLTTLSAVDAQLAPPRQVGDHPAGPSTPVWLFIYDGGLPRTLYLDESGQLQTSPPEEHLLHVADATNPATGDGAYVYIYGWSELGSPDLPTTMPAVQD